MSQNFFGLCGKIYQFKIYFTDRWVKGKKKELLFHANTESAVVQKSQVDEY